MIDDCWNNIGVHGDSSCPKLDEYVHCRNCPVYSAAAIDLLDVELPAGYRSYWTGHISQARAESEPLTDSAVVFRAGLDYMALPTAVFKEIAGLRAIHSIPGKRGGLVLGVANVRGQLVVCVSLALLLRLDANAERLPTATGPVAERFLVLEFEQNRIVCPVDEVYGIHRFQPRELLSVPATIAKSTAAYTKAVLPWENRSVALLDERLLFYAFERGLVWTAI